MKTWAVVAMVLGAIGSAALAGPEAGGQEKLPPKEQMEHMERAMELKAREAELVHEQKMRELDLAERQARVDRGRRGHWAHGKEKGGGMLLFVVVVNVLVTVWVCKDMREQKIGRALWVPIVLLTGMFGAILYAIVRNADLRAKLARPRDAGGE